MMGITITLPANITAFGTDLLLQTIVAGFTRVNPLVTLSTGDTTSFLMTPPSFFGFTSSSPVSSLTIDVSDADATGAGRLTLDNVAFGQAAAAVAVPEPGTIGLTALAVCGLLVSGAADDGRRPSR